MQITSFALQVALLIATGEACGNPLCPTAVDEQYGQIPTCPVTALQGKSRALGCARMPMGLGEVGENLAVQAIEKAQRIAIDGQTEFGSEGGDGIVGFDTLQIGPRTDKVMLMVDR